MHGFGSGVFFDGLFLAVFSEVLAVSSRIFSFPGAHTQGLFLVTQNKVFSFQEEVRSGSRWS